MEIHAPPPTQTPFQEAFGLDTRKKDVFPLGPLLRIIPLILCVLVIFFFSVPFPRKPVCRCREGIFTCLMKNRWVRALANPRHTSSLMAGQRPHGETPWGQMRWPLSSLGIKCRTVSTSPETGTKVEPQNTVPRDAKPASAWCSSPVAPLALPSGWCWTSCPFTRSQPGCRARGALRGGRREAGRGQPQRSRSPRDQSFVAPVPDGPRWHVTGLPAPVHTGSGHPRGRRRAGLPAPRRQHRAWGQQRGPRRLDRQSDPTSHPDRPSFF